MPRSAATDRYLRWISNMLKSPSNRSAPCSWRQARAILASLASSAMSAFSSVRPSRNRRTRTLTAGWYSITGAPTPAAAARTELRYSWSLSIASSSLPPEATLATNDPLPLVILKFRLVSPPGSSVTVRGRLATLGTWSKMASSSESTSVTLAPGVGDVARASAGSRTLLAPSLEDTLAASKLKRLDGSHGTFLEPPHARHHAAKGYGQ